MGCTSWVLLGGQTCWEFGNFEWTGIGKELGKRTQFSPLENERKAGLGI
jgi:hypothetical protein